MSDARAEIVDVGQGIAVRAVHGRYDSTKRHIRRDALLDQHRAEFVFGTIEMLACDKKWQPAMSMPRLKVGGQIANLR